MYKVSKFILLVFLVSLHVGCATQGKREKVRPLKNTRFTIVETKENKKYERIIDKKKLGNKFETFLRYNYCEELFLNEGIDVVTSTEVSIEHKAYNDCKEWKETKEWRDTHDFFPTYDLGLALSGGGTRSASFSIGVLKALNELNILDNIDAISSVSGGGYASYWFYMQEYYQNEKKNYSKLVEEGSFGNIPSLHTRDDIFKTVYDKNILEDNRFQDYLAKNSYIVNNSNNSLMRGIENTWHATTHFGISMPMNWIADGVFDWGYNNSVFALAYREGLERTYGLSPNSKYIPLLDYSNGREGEAPKKFLNGKNGYIFQEMKDVRSETLHFKDFRNFLIFRNKQTHLKNEKPKEDYSNPLPFPIINTTVSNNDKKLDEIEKAVFTFTPLSYGSLSTGYTHLSKDKRPVSVSKAFAISGAAVDYNARESSAFLTNLVLRAGNLAIGYEIKNPSKDGITPIWKKFNYWIHKIMPFPFYYVHNQALRDNNRPKIRLSDGGHAENLGAFSLITRATQRIIVVDAEQDGQYEFDALNRLNKNLEHDYNISIKEKGETHQNADFIAKKADDPVIELKVEGLYDPKGKERPIEMLYIKLSIDENKVSKDKCSTSIEKAVKAVDEYEVVDKEVVVGGVKTVVKEKVEKERYYYPCSVTKQYLKEKEEKLETGFPHNSTTDFFYDEAQFRAYRDLGYFITMTKFKKKYEDKWQGDLDLKKSRSKQFDYINKLVQENKNNVVSKSIKE